MKFVSYAQNFEDVMLARALKGVEKGFYIDVGAQDPTVDSVTKAFYERGWRGINIDPVPHWYQRLCDGRPHDTCLRVLVGAEQGNAIFYEVIGTGLSTMSPDYAQRHRERGFDVIESSVPVKTLDAICTEQAVDIVHFLKIDVEGAEEVVLHGFSFTKIRPWIVLLESREPNTQISNHGVWESYLLERDYQFVYDDGLNRFYVACEHNKLSEAFAVPPNVFDGFVLASDPASGIELASATAEIDQLKQGLGVFERRIATLQRDFESVKSDRDGLVRWAEELESRLTKEQRRGERTARLIGRLVEQRTAAVVRTEELTAQLVATDERLTEVARRAESAEAAIAKVGALRDRAAELSAANDALKADREGLRNWAEQLQVTLAREHTRIDSLAQQLGQVEADRAALVQREQALAEQLTDRDNRLKSESAASAREREGLTNWVEQLQETLAEKQARIESLVQQLGQVEAERAALVQREQALAEQLTERDSCLQAVKAEAAASAHEREGVRKELADQIARCEAAWRDLDDCEQMLATARRRARDVDAHASELQRQLAAMHVSRSWRLTKPLRWVMLCYRAWRGQHEPSDVLQPPALPKADLSARAAVALQRPEKAVVDNRVAALDQLGERLRSTSMKRRRTDSAASFENDRSENYK